MYSILIADDEKNIREGLARFVSVEGYEAVPVADGELALEQVRAREIDCALIDLRMPKINGEQLLATLVTERPLMPVIIITGHGTVQNAVAAMQNGAYDFITKPVNLDYLGALFKRALKNRRIALDNISLRNELQSRNSESTFTSTNPAMQRIMQVAKQVARTDATILITGESGVGKEVLADFIHAQSSRGSASMIKVHCASLTESLLESELFGHERGAFTGATAQRKGRFELADHGTIFLDEIGEINQQLQVKILRVLQQRAFERVGGERTIVVDVRIIAATNRDLKQEIADGTFREDLYYRLNVVQIEIPSLRDRKEDLPRLIAQFLREYNDSHNRDMPRKHFSQSAQDILLHYDWPGNIRELKNCVERAVILAQGNVIDADCLPESVLHSANTQRTQHHTSAQADMSKQNANTTHASISVPTHASLAEAERILIVNALKQAQGNKSKVAKQLGIQRTTLYEKMKKYGLMEMTLDTK